MSQSRRDTQLAYNHEHNITPKGVTKRILDVMEGAYASKGSDSPRSSRSVAETTNAYGKMVSIGRNPQGNFQQESLMYEQAKNLAFEEAAATRDRIAKLKQRMLRQ